MLLFVLAVIVAVAGLVQLLQGQLILGLVLLALACVLGPGGFSLLTGRTDRRSGRPV